MKSLIWGVVWWISAALACVMIFSKLTNGFDYLWASVLLFLVLVGIQLKWRAFPPWGKDARPQGQHPDEGTN